MSKRGSKHSLEDRDQAARQVIDQNYSILRVAKNYETSRTTLKTWVRKYKAEGLDGLKESRIWKRYPTNLKLEAVQDGPSSFAGCSQGYGISDESVLGLSINQYTNGKARKSTCKRRSTMTKGRKTTQQ